MTERTLTDADIQAIAAALKPEHTCRFHVTQEEFEHTWPAMVGIANNMTTVRNITLKLVITSIVLTVIGMIGRGLWVWVTEAQQHLPK